jgi:hypothetical protein
MHNKLLCIMLTVFVGSLAFAAKPEITNNGTFYIYSIFWQNGDFNSDFDDYGDQFFYMHADIGIHADFGSGISSQVTIGGWGTFGVHPITLEGDQGMTPGDNAGVREAYLDVANIFDSPLAFRAGKMHVYYPGQVSDGGEDGAMGVKFYGSTDVIDYDLAWYRLVENGGCFCAGLGPVEDDLDLFAAYFTAKFMEGGVRLSPYWFWRTQSMMIEDTLESFDVKDDPMWLGGRLDVGPIAGFSLNGEFTMMMGQYENEFLDYTLDYKGMHYMGKFSYAPPNLPIMLGGGYYVFTGDELDTLGDTGDENELYESPIWGPYTNDFYKWWPGFGPAHLQKTVFGFNLLAPFDTYATNLAVINGNIGFHQGPFMLRGDFFKYSKNWVADGVSDDMGMEIALLTTYTYKNALTLGGTVGYWMPGDWQADIYGDEADDAMLGGYLFVSVGF